MRRLPQDKCERQKLTSQITYDIQQVPREALPTLRTQLLALLKAFAPGPRPIRTQLCVCLAILAIQMKEWKNVVGSVVSTLGSDAESHACVLEFLRVLPEEVTEGRKISLTVRGPKYTSLRASAST
jgi:transportin-3